MGALNNPRADRQDRSLLFRSHPVLFPILMMLSRPRSFRIGNIVLVNDATLVKTVLVEAPLDRGGAGTAGGVIRAALGEDILFVGSGEEHKSQRRMLARHLRRPEPDAAFLEQLQRGSELLRRGEQVEVVEILRAAAGASTAALLGVSTPPLELARLVERVADLGARRLLGKNADLEDAVLEFSEAVRQAPKPGGMLAELTAEIGERAAISVVAVTAVAAYSTSVAAATRMFAWVADAERWGDVANDPVSLCELLLAHLTPSPLMPRRLQDAWRTGGVEWPAGARIVVNVRAACRRPDADGALANLAFGFGPHLCPGSIAARRQLVMALSLFAPLAPTIVARSVGNGRALPRWDRLVMRSTTVTDTNQGQL